MSWNKKQSLLIVILVVAFIITWNYFANDNHEELYYNNYNLKLSVLPDDFRESLSMLEEVAVQKKQQLNKRGFHLNVIPLSGKELIDRGTPLILQTYYHGSKKLVERVTEMPVSFAGLTTDELDRLSPDWQVKAYRPDRALILFREVNDLAPEDKKTMHLGVKDNRVAIFYGKSGNTYLKQITDIVVDDLPLSEQQALNEGVVINSEEELLTILEGLVSYNED